MKMFTTKTSLLFALCLFMSAGLFAQISIEKGYAGGGLGFTKLTGDIGEGGSGGLTSYIDGAIYLTPNIAVGIEGNFNFHGYKDINDDLKFRNASMYLAKAEYYFLDQSFSPFVGLGLGASNIERPESIVTEKKTVINFAASPRVGFVAGGFHMEFIYSFAGKEPEVDIEGVEAFNYNFWTISLGYRYPFEL